MTIEVLDVRITNTLTTDVVRDQILAILAAELANQIALATAASQPTTPYEINLSRERSHPWHDTEMPVCNVSYDTGNILGGSSPGTSDQQGDHFYNLDTYVEMPAIESAGTITHGDELAAIQASLSAGIIYQIIMTSINAKLQLPGVVGHRIIRELTPFQPSFGDLPAENVMAYRLKS